MDIPETRQCRDEQSPNYGDVAIAAIDSFTGLPRPNVWAVATPKGGRWVDDSHVENWEMLAPSDNSEATVWQCRDEDSDQFGSVAVKAQDPQTGAERPGVVAIFNPANSLYFSLADKIAEWTALEVPPAEGEE